MFGSYTRGTDKPSSDIDVAVLYAHTPRPELVAKKPGLIEV